MAENIAQTLRENLLTRYEEKMSSGGNSANDLEIIRKWLQSTPEMLETPDLTERRRVLHVEFENLMLVISEETTSQPKYLAVVDRYQRSNPPARRATGRPKQIFAGDLPFAVPTPDSES